MAITNASEEGLIPFIIGGAESIWKNRTGKDLVSLFQTYGFRDDVYDNGLPKLNGSNLNTSKTQYSRARLLQLDEESLKKLIEQLLIESANINEAIEEINNILLPDRVKITNKGDQGFMWEGVIVNEDVQNLALFRQNEKQVINAIKGARVSILVAMAWFTNEKIQEALEEKRLEGLRIEIVTFKDGVNAHHGVDLSNFDHKEIRGTRGGIMHNKFCVIDNLIVITGSYNWSTNAECRNDENILITCDHKTATKYSVEFRSLKPLL